jgi:hypothetical protein
MLLLTISANAQVSVLTAWTNTYNSTGNASSSITLGSGTTNRVLVVAVATSLTATGTRTVSVTYGTKTLTFVAGDLSSTTRQHTALYYLNGSDIAAEGNTATLAVTFTGGTTRVNTVWYSVYDYVDQSSPITNSRNYNGGTGNTSTLVYGTALTVNENERAIEVANTIRNPANTTPRTITPATNWTMSNEQTYTTTDGVRSGVYNRSVPTSNTTDVSSTTASGNCLGSMTGLSLNALTKRYRSLTSGTWGTLGTWQQSQNLGSSWATATTVPSNTEDAVTVLNSHTVTLSAASTASSLTIDAGGSLSTGATNTWTLDVSGATSISGTLTLSSTATKTFSGDVTINSGGVWNETGTSTINYAGSLTYNGSTFTASSGTHNFTGSSKNYGGTSTISIPTAVFSGTYTCVGSSTISSLTVNSGGSVSVDATKTLTVTTTLSNAGTLNLLSNSVGPATILTPDSIGGGGVYTISQYMTGEGGTTPSKRFWYTSNPMSGGTTNGFGISASSKLWKYEETGHTYNQISSNENNGKGRGYVSRFGANTTVTHGGGTAKYYSGDISIPVTRTGTTDGKRGYNLVGNPYPSYVYLDTLNSPGIETSMWYRSVNSGNTGMVYDTWNFYTEVGVVNSGSGALTKDIAPMQAFWVRAKNEGTTSVNFKQANRKHQPGSVALRSAEVANAPLIRMSVTNNVVSDGLVVGFYTNATEGFDNYDSYKFSNENAAVPEIFTMIGSDEVSINGMPPFVDTKELVVGFRTGTAGTFTLKTTELSNLEEGMTVVLKDKLLKISQDLTMSPNYTFVSDVANTSDRFSLLISKVVTKLQDPVQTSTFTAFAESNGCIHYQLNNLDLNGAWIRLLDVTGKVMESQPVTNSIGTINTRLTKGIYLVEVTKPGFKGTSKIVIN